MERKRHLILAVGLLAVGLTGCTVEVVSLKSKGVVMPETPKPVTVAGVMPWKVGADFLLALIPTMGQTRRLAIQEKVPYQEERSWTLFRVEKAGSSESKASRTGEDYTQERKEELR